LNGRNQNFTYCRRYYYSPCLLSPFVHTIPIHIRTQPDTRIMVNISDKAVIEKRLTTQDFSSAKVPISRETWAPRSPVKYSGDASPAGPPQQAPAPPTGSEPYRPPQRAYSSRSPPRGPYEDRARGPPREEGRRDDAPGGHGGYQRDQR
jgi:hypothetical protein